MNGVPSRGASRRSRSVAQHLETLPLTSRRFLSVRGRSHNSPKLVGRKKAGDKFFRPNLFHAFSKLAPIVHSNPCLGPLPWLREGTSCSLCSVAPSGSPLAAASPSPSLRPFSVPRPCRPLANPGRHFEIFPLYSTECHLTVRKKTT